MTTETPTPRIDPQCLAGSFEQPWCAAERFKERIAELERALTLEQRIAELEQREKDMAVILVLGANQTESMYQRAEAAEREVKRVTELHKELMAEADKRVEAAESALKAQEKELELARKLHWLAAHDHIFFASYNDEIKDWDSGAHPAINCNDIFVPGADAESLKLADVDIFLKVCKEFPHHGDIAWCIVKRAEKPWRNYPEAEAIVPQVKAIINAALAQDEK